MGNYKPTMMSVYSTKYVAYSFYSTYIVVRLNPDYLNIQLSGINFCMCACDVKYVYKLCICLCMYVCMCVCVYYVCVNVCMYIRRYVCMYVCM